MSEEPRNCPFCECEAWTPTGIFGKPGRKCSECDFETYISFWDKFPRITPHERQWMESAPQFDDDGQTDVMFNEVAVRDDAYWDVNRKSWIEVEIGETYAVIRRKKQPAWEVGMGFEVSHGHPSHHQINMIFSITSKSGRKWVEFVNLKFNEGTSRTVKGGRWLESMVSETPIPHAELLRLAADRAEGEGD